MTNPGKECPNCGTWFEFEETVISGGGGCSLWDGPPRCSLCQTLQDQKDAEARAKRTPYVEPKPKANPYYHPELCGLEIIGSLDDPDLSYEFNTLVFWFRPSTKEVLCASDAGCSCPTPFDEVLGGEGLETIGSWRDARNAIGSWLSGCETRPPAGEVEDLIRKLKGYIH